LLAMRQGVAVVACARRCAAVPLRPLLQIP